MKINYSTTKFVIIGAGETGKSIVNYLQQRNAQVLRILDTRDNPPQIAVHQVIGGALDYANLADADIIAISPGVSIYEPVLQQALCSGKHVVGDIELFAREISDWQSRVIGITGSNGKTTVTSLTGFLAEHSGVNTLVAGNIGVQVLDALLECDKHNSYPELIVLELSSFQLETLTSLNFASATVLNISEDHLDRYRDLLEYAYVKAHIFNHCQHQVLNIEDQLVLAMARHGIAQSFFGEKHGNYHLTNDNDPVLQINGVEYLKSSALQLVGRHNYLNVLASLALLAGAGYDLAQFKAACVQFAGLEHRMQKVAEHEGILYIEDSKGTNVGAVIAGVGGIDRPVHLILGGDGKGQDFAPLRELVLNKCKSVAVIGQDKEAILAILAGIDNVAAYMSLEDAVAACIKNANFGDAVILSPACASWDMFTNYKHRAQVFVDSIYAHIH
ncbi:MAG: UDP-N-acetylmuramoyl-L-alanine--D-glutamate ligase [Neisseriaceae bacterium]|nr:MAG: UDP-N-acetylmuramoyl-L-alanine--D-glutamate ligase [Neisseriaceae bacterium]